MDSSYDIAIVGAGLSGAFSAFHLSRRKRVIVLEKDFAAAGASGAGAGIVNPFMARKANPIWRWDDAMHALESTLREAGCAELFRRQGVFRPAQDQKQAEWFRQVGEAYGGECCWLDSREAASRWPKVQSPLGGLFVQRGGSIDLPTLVEHLLNAAGNRGCESHDQTNVFGIHPDGTTVVVDTDFGDFAARKVLLCVGADHAQWPLLTSLPLHGLKGQTVTVERPAGLGSALPCLSGSGYIVPYPDHLVLGSTYHHEFGHRLPTSADTREILEKTSRMIPAVAESRVTSKAAGVRVTVPETRLPIVGPLSDAHNAWVVTGLGAKGLLMGALIGKHLSTWLEAPESIPPELAGGLTGGSGRPIRPERTPEEQ